MPIRTKFGLIERDITVLFPELASAQAKKDTLVKFAREALADAQKQNASVLGRVPPHDTFVDDRKGAALESARPESKITFEFQLVEDILTWIEEWLVLHSPVGKDDDPRPGHPGLYAKSHVLLADLKEISLDEPISPAETYAFVSTVPYARKIERGLSKTQAPDGVYQVVAELAQQRFSNMARVRFTYLSPMFGPVDDWASTTRLQSKQASRNRPGQKRHDWLTRNPAISITSR